MEFPITWPRKNAGTAQAELVDSRTLTNNDENAKFADDRRTSALLNATIVSDTIRLRIEKNGFSPTASSLF
jgi:hypothetical protein